MDKTNTSEVHRRLRLRVQRALRRARRRRLETTVLPQPPRYDEVYANGLKWLDRLAFYDRWPADDSGEAQG